MASRKPNSLGDEKLTQGSQALRITVDANEALVFWTLAVVNNQVASLAGEFDYSFWHMRQMYSVAY